MKYLVKCIKHKHGDIVWKDIIAETTSEDAAKWLVDYCMKKYKHNIMFENIHYTYDEIMEDSDILQLWLESVKKHEIVNIDDVKIEF